MSRAAVSVGTSRLPRSGSGGVSIRSKQAPAPTRPEVMGWETSVRCFIGEIVSSIAVMKAMKSPTVA